MKTPREVFEEVLVELGFADYKPDQMTNSDYWLCTITAMERYAKLVKIDSEREIIRLVKELRDRH